MINKSLLKNSGKVASERNLKKKKKGKKGAYFLKYLRLKAKKHTGN
jgi:hypothetical protein